MKKTYIKIYLVKYYRIKKKKKILSYNIIIYLIYLLYILKRLKKKNLIKNSKAKMKLPSIQKVNLTKR